MQQDDNKDLEPGRQEDEIEKSEQETQQDGIKEPGQNILKVLTPYCFQVIFAYLTINDLVRSERVCRGWRDLVLQYLPSVQNYRIAFSNSACRVPDRCIAFRSITLSIRKGEFNKMIHKIGKYFVRVYSDCIDEEDSKALPVHCPHLEYLLLSGTNVDLLFDEIENDLTDEESLPKKKLTGIFLSDLRLDLKTLGLSFFKGFKVEYLQSAVHRLTALTRLDLNFNSVETLRNVSLLLEKMPLLEQLSLMEYEQCGEPGIDPPCFDRLPRLRELHLWGNDFVTDCWVEAAANCESLRVLNVGTCFEVSMTAVVALCQKRCGLVELVVSKLRVTDEDLEACVRYCKDLELLDASWCSWLTSNVLTRLSRPNTRPNTRPLVLRLRGTKIPKNNIVYEGLILRLDLTPELYNPLHVRYDRGPPDYFSLYDSHSLTDCGHGSVRSRSPHEPNLSDHGIAAKDVVPAGDVIRTEGHAEDSIRAEGAILAEEAIHVEDDIRAENAMHAEEATPAVDGIRAEDAMYEDDNIRVEAAVRVEDDIRAEAGIRAEDVMRAEDAMHADDNIRVEAAVRAEDEIRAEAGIRAEDVMRAEDAMHANDNLRVEVAVRAEDGIRAEDAMHADNIRVEAAMHPEDAIRAENAMHAEDAIRAENAMHAEDAIRAENAMHAEDNVHAEDDLRAENAMHPEDAMHAENEIPVEDAMHAEDNILLGAAIHPEGDIRGEANNRAEDDILPVIIIHEEDVIPEENALLHVGHARDDLREENNVDMERIPRENLIRAIAIVHEEDDQILENGIHPEDDIFPDNDMFPDNEIFPYIRVEDEDRIHVQEIPAADNMFAEDGLFPDDEDQVFIIHEEDDRPAQNGDPERRRRVLNRMFEEYGVDQGNGMADEHDIFAHDDIHMDDDLDDVDD